jgi:hypothetical protein
MTAFEELGVLPELGRALTEMGWRFVFVFTMPNKSKGPPTLFPQIRKFTDFE